MRPLPRDWRARRVDVATDYALLQRARTQFYGRHDERYLEWMYRANPAGAAWCHVAMAGDEVVGQYAAIPIDMVAGSRSFKAARGIDAFTHASYRRQGVFVALAEAVWADAAAAGARLVIGTPNPDSRRGLEKAQFAQPFEVHWMVRPRPRTLLPRDVTRAVQRPLRMLSHVFSALRIDAPHAVPPEWIDRLSEQCRPATVIGLAKTGAWFRWRFEHNPRVSYRYLRGARSDGTPAGVLVWNREPSREGKCPAAVVVDLEATSREDRDGLLDAFLQELPDDIAVVHALAPRSSGVERSLLEAGFVPGDDYPFFCRADPGDAELRTVLAANTWPVSGVYADTL